MAHFPAPSDPKFDAHFAAIGRLVDRWAHLEHQIDLAIWQCAGVEQMFGACITSQLIGVNGRLRALRSLVTLLGASDASQQKIGKFAGSLSGLQTKRNRAAHDPRMIHGETEQVHRLEMTAHNTLVFGFQREPIDDLKKFSEQIGNKIVEFRALFNAVADEINALPDTARPQLQRIVHLTQDAEAPSIES